MKTLTTSAADRPKTLERLERLEEMVKGHLRAVSTDLSYLLASHREALAENERLRERLGDRDFAQILDRDEISRLRKLADDYPNLSAKLREALQRERELRDALRKLAAEVSPSVLEEFRRVWGNTNTAVLKLRAEEARAALSKGEGEPEEAT